MLPRFFRRGMAVSNQAESGLGLFSFERQKRLEKMLRMMKMGDQLCTSSVTTTRRTRRRARVRPRATRTRDQQRGAEVAARPGKAAG